MGGANTGLRLWDGDGGPQSICSRGATWPSPYPGHKPAGQAGDTLPFPSGEGEEDSGLGQAATLYCPIPFSANQNGFEVCLKMKPRYASVFMMLAMFLQSSMPLWGRPMCCRLRPLFMSRSPFLGQQPMAKL